METLPIYVNALFIVTALLTLVILLKATPKPAIVAAIVITWLVIQAFVVNSGFYHNITSLPPRFVFLVAPPVLLIILLFITKAGKAFIDNSNARWLTGLHTIRIAVEIVLFLLYQHNYIPRIMTFEGHNFDIISGLTAPFILLFGYYKPFLNKTILLAWNFICIALLLNIVVIALLSAPSSVQQFGFDQPNIAILQFPYYWLPCFVVPTVLFAHLVSIKQLIKAKSWQKTRGMSY
ncbi:hypothetical protein GCM10023149_34800 [Mucilaginibacter gynuensis]|uniref:Lycopene cyclase domain-containing protein n=1 Tax=Mucilaginibacter gynuensis TaxID=1302236 RepID=A0ABP8GUG9_9SPHI